MLPENYNRRIKGGEVENPEYFICLKMKLKEIEIISRQIPQKVQPLGGNRRGLASVWR